MVICRIGFSLVSQSTYLISIPGKQNVAREKFCKLDSGKYFTIIIELKLFTGFYKMTPLMNFYSPKNDRPT